MTNTESAKNAEIHDTALQQFQRSFDATKSSRELAKMCRRFVGIRGAQWDWDADGDFANKMKLEIDHVSGAVERIKNEYRKSRIAAKFVPVDGKDADALSDAVASRYRSDTNTPSGRDARDTAFDSAVEGGFGGMRLRSEYENEDKGYQRICLEPINDAESTLFFDANAKMKDKSDARHAFLITPWVRQSFIDTYGEECASWPSDMIARVGFDWFGEGTDIVYVAEYFMKEKRTDTYRVFQGFGDETQEFLSDDVTPDDMEALLATGFQEIEPRKEKIDRVVKYVMNGAKILEPMAVIPGREIPLIPQYGHRTVINHVEVFRGRVLKSVDGQIIYNLSISQVGATAAASTHRLPIFVDEQVNPYAAEWDSANIENPAYLRVAAMRDLNGNPMPSGPISYLEPPVIAPATAALIQMMRQDVADQLGNPENGQMMVPDQSGVALDMVQSSIDMGSFGYMDNAGDAERRVAAIWLSMASEIYVEDGRAIKTVSENNKRGSIVIGSKTFDPETGALNNQIDFGQARFDIEVDVGPTSASRRASIVRTAISFMAATPDPETQAILSHTALMNLDDEGISHLRDYSRKKLVGMGVIKPTVEEEKAAQAAAAQPQQPDPNAVLAEAMATEAEAKAGKASADTQLAAARTEQVQAETAKILTEIPLGQRKQAFSEAQAIAGELNAGQ